MRLSRLATLAWALILFGLAVIALHKVGRVVEVGLQIASVAYGALLGAFLLGTDAPGKSARCNCRNGNGFFPRTLSLAWYARALDVVGHARNHRHFYRRVDG